MTVYPDLNITASHLVPSFLTQVNIATTINNIPVFGVGLFIVLLMSILVSAKRIYSFEAAFTYASLVHAIIAGLAVKFGFFTTTYFYLSILLLIAAVILLALKGGGSRE